MMISAMVLVASFFAVAFASSDVEYLVPPAMAHTNWPIAHGSTWNSDTSALSGPTRKDRAVQVLVNGDHITDLSDILLTADSITIAQSSVDGYMWGSGVSGVYQLKVTEEEVVVANTLFRDVNFEYHGAYSLVAADGTYYTAARTSIQAYHNEVPLNFSTPIVKVGEYFVNGLVDGEHIVGLTMTHDDVENAYLVFATTRGQVGAVSLDFKTTSTGLYQISGIDEVELPDHFVSNSIALDGPDGGIYVCTSKSMTKLRWDLETRTISSVWATDYGSGGDPWYYGRIGPGSGTSPTLMGPNGAAELVVIGDGETPMNVLFYDAKSGDEVGRQVVAFGGATGGNSTTEQSIVVLGYKALLSNNWVNDKVTPFCSEWFASIGVSDALKMECPYLFGSYVNGLEQFEYKPDTGEVVSTWANPDITCTSTVPLVSAADGVIYCLGKRTRPERRDVYTVEAISWETGRSLHHVELSTTLLANGLYAGTIIGTKGDIVMGCLAGIVRVSQNGADPVAGGDGTNAVEEADLVRLNKSPVWKLMQQMADWNELGHVPSAAELQLMGM